MDGFHVYCFKSIGILQAQLVKNRTLGDSLLETILYKCGMVVKKTWI